MRSEHIGLVVIRHVEGKRWCYRMVSSMCVLFWLGCSRPLPGVSERGSGTDVRSFACPASGCAYDVVIKGSTTMQDMALPSLAAALRSLDVCTARGIRSDAW